jgi:hypothetical protein
MVMSMRWRGEGKHELLMGITRKMIRSFEGRREIQDTRNLIQDTTSLKLQEVPFKQIPILTKDGRRLIQVSRNLN